MINCNKYSVQVKLMLLGWFLFWTYHPGINDYLHHILITLHKLLLSFLFKLSHFVTITTSHCQAFWTIEIKAPVTRIRFQIVPFSFRHVFMIVFFVSVYSLSPEVWQSFVTIRSCNCFVRTVSTYVGNFKEKLHLVNMTFNVSYGRSYVSLQTKSPNYLNSAITEAWGSSENQAWSENVKRKMSGLLQIIKLVNRPPWSIVILLNSFSQ